MEYNIFKSRGTPTSYTDERGGAVLLSRPVIGIVKNNIDPTHTGKIEVYIARLNGYNQENPVGWVPVRYLSPFGGSTQSTSSPDDEGKYKSNPHSYGFWATPPDINTQVLCVFANGDINFGYYIGSIPGSGLTHMLPAIGSNEKVVANSKESEAYGGAPRLPVTEINDINPEKDNNELFVDQSRTVHSYQAAMLNIQGLIRDPVRGTINSTAARETPSGVIGLSSPGRPYYKGGYTDEDIEGAVSSEGTPAENFKVVGRKGGHSLVMDDGDLTGKEQLVRLRSGTGHQILMHDKEETIFLIHANGKSWIEMGKEGTIDIYNTNSTNIRTHGDVNIHAERDINMFAKRNFNLKAEQINLESTKNTLLRAGKDYNQYVVGKYTLKVDDAMSLQSKGAASIASDAITYVNGKKINLNTGSASLVPDKVAAIVVKKHDDTLYDKKKGFTPAPNKLESINSRVPAHSPWTGANKGVDVKVDFSSDKNLPDDPSPSTTAANSAAPDSPQSPTNPAYASTVPPGSVGGEDPNTNSALVSQTAVTAANTPNPGPEAMGSFNQTPADLAKAGALKPGADKVVMKAIAQGKSLADAMPSALWTGNNGVTDFDSYLNNIPAQSGIQASLLDGATTSLIEAGLIKGTESLTQTGGLIMAAAALGVAAVSNFVKTSSGTGAANPNIPTTPSTLGPLTDLVAGGNYAARMADQTSSGINPTLATNSTTKGAVAGTFDAVTGAYKPFKAGTPVNLGKISGLPKSPTTDQVTLAGIPGGLTATSNVVDVSVILASITKSVEIKALIDQAAGLPTDANTALIRAKLIAGKTNLETLAVSGLTPEQIVRLYSAVSALTNGSSISIKLPTVGSNSLSPSDIALKLQTEQLIDPDAKPTTQQIIDSTNTQNTLTINSTTQPVLTKAIIQAGIAALRIEETRYNTIKQNLKSEYDNAKTTYGPNATQTLQTYEKYKTAVKQVSDIQDQVADLIKKLN